MQRETVNEKVSWKDYTKEYYDFHIAHTSSQSNYVKRRNKRIFNLIPYSKGEKRRILDLGCGVGTFTFESAKFGFSTIGIDFSREAAKISKKFIHENDVGERCDIIQADISHLPFKQNEIFDVIIAADVVEHLYDDQYKSMLKDGYGILKKGGILIMYTDNPFYWANSKTLQKFSYLLKRNKENLETLAHEHTSKFDYLHVYLKSMKYLRDTLSELNFKIKYAKFFFDSSTVYVKVIYKLSKVVPYLKHLFCDHIIIKAEK